jgi:EmrB/QacA subfamily drug resistance transporter
VAGGEITPQGASEQPAVDRRARIAILLTCSLSLFIVSMDSTIVNVALPSIGHDFSARLDGLQWVVDAYLLVLATLLIVSGSTGDRIGRRRVFQIGLVIFGLGSLACSVAPSLPALIAFRMLQAIGGSMLNPNSLSIIANVFTEPRERAAAIGIWGSVFGVSAAAGPILGGLLTDSVGWRAVFWVNLPIVLVALILTRRFVPESRAPRARRIDPAGQVLAAVLLGALCFGIVEGPRDGWSSSGILAAFAAAAAALIAFVIVERRQHEPLLDLRFFRSPLLTGASLIAVLTFIVVAGFLFLNTLYLQTARGYSPLHAGLAILPTSIAIIIAAPITGRIVGRRGARLPMVVGGLLMAAGAALLATVTLSTGYPELALAYALIGLGSGTINPPISNAAVSGMPRAQAGAAAAIASTSRQIGSALGVALTGSVIAAQVPGLARHGVSTAVRQAFTSSTHAGWVLFAACALAISLVALATSGAWGRARAERAAAALADASL